ncbi:restriction endonuclease-related protein [Streptomyces sp. NPDC001205]
MAVKGALADAERRDQAVTACCMAAVAESDPTLAPDRRSRVLMDCLAVLRAAHRPEHAAQFGMREFRRALRGPLGTLLPPAAGRPDRFDGMQLFDAQGLVGDTVKDLCSEHLVPQAALEQYWPWARVRAEQEEQRLYGLMRRLAPDEYRRARELLGTHAAGPVRKLSRQWDTLWMRFDFFEPVADWPWCQVDGWWYPCPVCRWPMRAARTGAAFDVRCEAHAPRGVHYRCTPPGGNGPGELIATGRAATPVTALPASSEHLALSRAVWRYGTLPVLLELQMRDLLGGLPYVEVHMWPGQVQPDEYDLHITASPPGRRRRHWRVDAKAWASVAALGKALRDRPTVLKGLTIVLPDHQDSERHLLSAYVRDRGLKVMTVSGLVKQVQAVCGSR